MSGIDSGDLGHSYRDVLGQLDRARGMAMTLEEKLAKVVQIATEAIYDYAAEVDQEWGCGHKVEQLEAAQLDVEHEDWLPLPDSCAGMTLLDQWLVAIDLALDPDDTDATPAAPEAMPHA